MANLGRRPKSCFGVRVENADFQANPERTEGTYSKYNSIDDKTDGYHYWTTFIKFGIGRATYDAAQEIRSGDLTREEGIALVKKFDGEFPERWASQIFNYLSLPKEQFPNTSEHFEQPIFDRHYYDLLSDQFRSPHLWKWNEEEGWVLRHRIFDGLQENYQESTASQWKGN